MWLSSGNLSSVTSAVVRGLVESQLVETDAPAEVAKDITAVFEQYIRDEQDISNRARDLAQSRGLSPAEVGRMRRDMARQRGIGIGEEAIDYLLAQLLEMLMHSAAVEEVYGEDHQLKLAMRGPLREAYAAADKIEEQVRKRMKHVTEGTSQWEIEYQRMREEVTRRRS